LSRDGSRSINNAAMPWEGILIAFITVFLAELGDKTQLAVFSLAATRGPRSVFLGASLALVLSTALAALLGGIVHRFLPQGAIRSLHYGAGALFIAVGIWTILRAT